MENSHIVKPKRYLKIEKGKHRKYHLEDFNLLVKILYPTRKSINKFTRLLEEKTEFSSSQKGLILEVAHSLTMINEMYRSQDKCGRLYVSREDMLNSIYMLQNELELAKSEYLLSANLRWFYKQLRLCYPDNEDVFTVREVMLKMRCSKNNAYTKLGELVDRALVEVAEVKGQTYVYKLVAK